MFYYPYFPQNDYFISLRQSNSYIRLLHASPDAPAVDIYANGSLLARNLAYRGFTEYMTIPAGRYNIRVFPTGTMINPVMETIVEIPPQSIITIAVVGGLPEISLQLIPDPALTVPEGMLMLRFAHLAPGAPNVDVTLPNGTRVFSNVAYRQVSDYIPVNPGTYTFQLRPAGSGAVVLNVPNIRLLPGRLYTIYAVGFAGGTPGLQMLIPLDGGSYIGV